MFLVEHGGKEEGRPRRTAFNACLNLGGSDEGVLLIAGDSDAVLNTGNSWFHSGNKSDKRWLHEFLETPGIRMIWTANAIRHLEDSVVRRFSYNLRFEPFNTLQRRQVLDTVLVDHHLDSFFTSAERKNLAAQHAVSAGVVEQAVRKTAEMGSDDKEEVQTAVRLSLEAYQSFAGKPRAQLAAIEVDPSGFVLEGLNVAGCSLDALLTKATAFTEYIQNPENNDVRSLSLLFHGQPGTGKSHFARFIARHVDRKIVFKHTSDIMSAYVGETEQNIRDAFEEAASKEAVLIFDEADSLLGSRDGALHSWERTRVNEILTWMECFRGIPIYTTNRLADLDSAAIRRFNHKLEFGYLKPEGVGLFYKKILGPRIAAKLNKKEENELKGIHNLTPGDFNAVKTQFAFAPKEKLRHKSEALKEEARIKHFHSGKKAIGF